MNATISLRRTLLMVLALGVGAPALTAQRTWIVDAAGGPGADFTTLAAGVQAAAAGDRVRVRAGRYRGAEIHKPIAVLGDPGAEIEVDRSHPGLSVTGIGATEVASIRGFDFPAPGGLPPVVVTDCAGRVVLADLRVASGPAIWAITITDAAAVTVDRCVAGMLTEIKRSKVLATGCEFRPGSVFNAAALAVEQGALTLVQCQALVPATRSIHAVLCHDSSIELRGTAAQEIRSGYQFIRGGQIIPLPAIRATGTSSLVADPDVALLPIGPTGFRTDLRRESSWLTATGGQIGGSVELNLGAQAGDAFVLFVGLPGPALPLAHWGDVWLDPRFLLQIDRGTLPAAAEIRRTRGVPNSPGLVGLALTYQAVLGSAPSLTNGASVMLYTP